MVRRAHRRHAGFVLALGVLVAAACGGRPAAPPPSAGQSVPEPGDDAVSEGEKSRRMQAEGAAIEERWREVQSMEGSAAEKEQAVRELEERQRALLREGEGGGGEEERH